VTVRLQVIGGGKMGEALVGGLIAEGWAAPAELAILEPLAERRAVLDRSLPGVALPDEALPDTDALLAVKPDHVPAALDALAGKSVPRLLSIAAGIRLEALERGLEASPGPGAPPTVVVRAMPNTPALVAEGAAAISGGRTAGDSDLEWASSILGAVGTVEIVPEEMLDAVTALSGSGPAYVFLLAEHMMAAGASVGLPPAVAERLTKQTLLGSSRLLAESEETAGQLRVNVTSPGGTTAAALEVFHTEDFGGAVERAIAAACARSLELGD
jgi:pyrroline-5-carboxylate reductase